MSTCLDSTSVNVRRAFRLESDQETELHWGASWVRSKIPQSPPEANNFLNELQHHINGAIIQYHRVQHDVETAQRLWVESSQRLPDYLLGTCPPEDLHDTLDRFGDTAFTLTFLDIHFCIISLEKIENLCRSFFRSINPLFQTVTREQVETYRNIRRDFEQALSGINEARNFLEHIDEEIRQGHAPTLSYHLAEDGLIVTFGDSSQSASLNVPLIDSAYEALIRLLLSLPDYEPSRTDSGAA